MSGKKDYIDWFRWCYNGAIVAGMYILIGIIMFLSVIPYWSKYNVANDFEINLIALYLCSCIVAFVVMIFLIAEKGSPKERVLDDLFKAAVFRCLTGFAPNQTTNLTADSLPSMSPDINKRKINLRYKSGFESGIPFDPSNPQKALDDMIEDIQSKQADKSGGEKEESDNFRSKSAETSSVNPVTTQ